MSILRLLLLLILATPALAAGRGDVILRHVTVIDVERGVAVPGQAVVTRGGDIVATGDDAAVARAWKARRTVDGTGRFLIPGLWDMHVHFGGGPELIEENKALLPLYIAHGITSVRDCAGDLPYDVLRWRDEIADGTLFGPTLYTSGPKIEGLKPIWQGTIETGSKADVDAALDKLAGLKVDFVKITDSTLDPALFLYAVGAARARGLNVSGHIPMADTIEQAIEAGISSIEHLDYAFKAGATEEAAVAQAFAAGTIVRAEADRRIDASFDPATARAAYRRMAAAGVTVTPTLLISRTTGWLDSESHADDPMLAYIGPGLRKTYDWRVQRAAQASPAEIARRHAHFEKMAAILPLLAESGVAIMAGTDAGFLNSYVYPGQGLHDEIGLFVKYGLTPAQALRSATRAGPAWFGKLNRFGAIETGKAADLVLLDANPLERIEATREIRGVMLRGRWHDRAALNAILADTKNRVAAWDRP